MNFDKVWEDLREQRKRESYMLEEWQIDATMFFWIQRKLRIASEMGLTRYGN